MPDDRPPIRTYRDVDITFGDPKADDVYDTNQAKAVLEHWAARDRGETRRGVFDRNGDFVEVDADYGWTVPLKLADFTSSTGGSIVDMLYKADPVFYDLEHRPGFHRWRDWLGRGWEWRLHAVRACGEWWHRRWLWGSLSVGLDCTFGQSSTDGDSLTISWDARATRPGRSFGWFTVLGPEWTGPSIEEVLDGLDGN